ncbi:AraC family transcriptional regulator [Aestuariibacter halophilus]|uniref:AraC family transcriptional regulator n=1 Tax=Fluctibacter halophilus TaxID=226011 RepID=A0ABS8G2Q5_9ALTE|nr:AraC family transcriptional regulator [Aestuariibacter halophilus]MCC2614753.1 AraC family transcriptional regulator [Aestuariibacter halophilus]
MENLPLPELQLLTALGLLISQLWVRNKQPLHLLFALFCGSMAVCAAQNLTAGQVGNFSYLIAMCSIATCNGYWLVSRAMFRGASGLALRHYLVAGSVGLMIIALQGLAWSQNALADSPLMINNAHQAVGKLLGLVSSTLLMLTLWEGCRGLRHLSGQQRRQRYVFLASYCGALLISTVGITLFTTPENQPYLREQINALCAVQIMLVTQGLIVWRARNQSTTTPTAQPKPVQRADQEDLHLAGQIREQLIEQQLYLQHQLRVSDLARVLDEPEYRVSRVMREQLQAQNFNHYVNGLRIQHAKTLLAESANTHWPIVVIGMESGFASVGPFTRAFKAFVGQTPNQYRQACLQRNQATYACSLSPEQISR